MGLSSDLISQFAKITNDNGAQKDEDKILYGTIVDYNGSLCVQLDGSDQRTPAVTTATIKATDRVSVELKNHTAIITGNLSDPSLGRMSSDSRFSAIEQSLKEITISVGNIDSQIESRLTVAENQISLAVQNLNNEITSRIGVYDGKIESLVGNQQTFSKFVQDMNQFSFINPNGEVKISGGDINLTGCIKFGDLTDAATVQQSIENANSIASNAVQTANGVAGTAAEALKKAKNASDWADTAYDKALEAEKTAQSLGVPDYIKSTYIDEVEIRSPTIKGNEVMVYGTFQTWGNDGVSMRACGYMGAAKGLDAVGNDTVGVALSYKWDYDDYTVGDKYVIVTNGGVRLQAGNHSLVVTKNGAFYDGEEIATK